MELSCEVASLKIAKVTSSAFTPLRSPVFRRLWIANGVSTLGFWMQQVAGAWLMTQLTRSPSLVALLATAAALPTFIFALPAGALADIVDRRRLIIVTQIWQLGTAAAMGALTLAGAMTPAVLLAGIAAYGLGNTLGLPPQSAIIPELVDAEDLPQAMALNATGFTAAQALGPALGGALVVAVGPGWAFMANAISFVGTLAVFVAWRRPPQSVGLPPEHVIGAVRTGMRYVLNAPVFRVVLLRFAVQMFCFAAVPGLLVVAVRTHLHSSAGGYGIALGVFGVGGVASAFLLLPRLRAHFSIDALTLGGAIVLAIGVFFEVALAPSLTAALPGLFVGGAASMLVMSTLQAVSQEVLPAWVRGRGLAVVQLVFQAALAVGAIVWGAVATADGIVAALIAAGVAMIVLSLAAVVGGARLGRVASLDITPAVAWTAPADELAAGLIPADGPVVTLVEYDVSPEDEEAFRAAIRDLGHARRRDGALQWSVARDTERPTHHVESYVLSSWLEHERELARVNRADAAAARAVYDLHRGPGAPTVRHLLGHHGPMRITRSLHRRHSREREPASH